MNKPISASVNEEQNIPLDMHLSDLDLIRINEDEYHAIWQNKSLRILVQSWSRDEKTISLEVNDEKYDITLHDELDHLIRQMGYNTAAQNTLENIHAPMPGRVLRVDIESGDKVKIGDPLLILEAMKMENIIKATTDGIIKRVHTSSGLTVDKGDLIIEYESTKI